MTFELGSELLKAEIIKNSFPRRAYQVCKDGTEGTVRVKALGNGSRLVCPIECGILSLGNTKPSLSKKVIGKVRYFVLKNPEA